MDAETSSAWRCLYGFLFDPRPFAQRVGFAARSALADLADAAGEFLEIAGLAEILVDTREADVGDRIEAFQPLHHHLADLLGGDFRIALGFQPALDARHQFLDHHRIDRPLARGDRDRAHQLVAIERLALVLAFQHPQLAELDTLERGEARRATFALPPPPDRGAVLGRAAVLDLARFVAAERAAHYCVS